MDPARIHCIVFDFSMTLAGGRYFAPLGPAALDIIGELVFGSNSSHWADPWMRGDLSSDDIVAYLAQHLPYSKERIMAALHQGCRNLPFNPVVHQFAAKQRETGRRTALVTLNMDVFTQTVIPTYRLDSLFDLVLNSSDYRTLEKKLLWRMALDELGPEHSFATSLLIDDSAKMVRHFRSLGGQAFRYEGDEGFRSWLADVGF